MIGTARWLLGATVLLAAGTARAAETPQPSIYYHEPLKIRSPSPKALGMFGRSLAGAGDVDGDGFVDILIGSPGVDVNTAQADVFFGPDFTRTLTLRNPRAKILSSYASALCGLGDVNGDGKSDLLVADATSGGELDVSGGESFIYVHPGTSGPMIRQAPQPQSGNSFGASAACLGDLDKDGSPDFLVGSPYYDWQARGARSNEGKAFVHFGPDFTEVRVLQAPAAGPGALFGQSVDGALDVDGDENLDLIVGAPQAAVEGTAGAGEVHVFFGPDHTRVRTLRMPGPPQRDAQFGASVAGVGDADGDGHDDVLVGVPFRDTGAMIRTGAAYLFLGPDLDPNTAIEITDPAATPLAVFGTSISRVGDVDGDGKAELFISAPGRNTAMLLRGADRSVLWTFTLTEGANFWAESIRGTQDLNADGAPDLLVGMPRACLPASEPAATAGVLAAGVRAEICPDPNDLSEVGLTKIVLSGFPKLEPAPAVGGTQVRVANVHPAGSAVVVRLEGGGEPLLGQAVDGGAGDLDGTEDGVVWLALAGPVEDGTQLRSENTSTGLIGRPAAARAVPAPPAFVLALLALAAGAFLRAGWSSGGRRTS